MNTPALDPQLERVEEMADKVQSVLEIQRERIQNLKEIITLQQTVQKEQEQTILELHRWVGALREELEFRIGEKETRAILVAALKEGGD